MWWGICIVVDFRKWNWSKATLITKVKVFSNRLKVCFFVCKYSTLCYKVALGVDSIPTDIGGLLANTILELQSTKRRKGPPFQSSERVWASRVTVVVCFTDGVFLPVCDLNRLCSGRQEMWVMLALCVYKHLYPRVIERCHLCLQNTWTDSRHTLTYCLISVYQRTERLDHALFEEHFTSSELSGVFIFSVLCNRGF